MMVSSVEENLKNYNSVIGDLMCQLAEANTCMVEARNEYAALEKEWKSSKEELNNLITHKNEELEQFAEVCPTELDIGAAEENICTSKMKKKLKDLKSALVSERFDFYRDFMNKIDSIADEIRNKVDSFKSRSSMLQLKIQTKADDFGKELDDLVSSIDELGRIDDDKLTEQLAECRANCLDKKIVVVDLEKYKTELDEKEKAVEMLKEQAESYRKKAAATVNILDACQNRLDRCQEKIELLRLDEMKKMYEAEALLMSNQIESQQEEITKLQNEIFAQQKDLEDNQKQAIDLQTRNDELLLKLNFAEAEKDRQELTLKELIEKLTSLETKYEKHSCESKAEKENLNRLLDDILEDKTKVSRELAAQTSRTAELEARIQELRETNNSLESMVGPLKEELEAMTQALGKALGHRNNKQKIHHVMDLKKKIATLEEVNQKLLAENSKLRHERLRASDNRGGGAQRPGPSRSPNR